MSTEKYPVGTVFVQVAPSYDDFFDSLSRNARQFDRAFADEMDKSDALPDAMERAAKRSTARVKKAMATGGREAGDAFSASALPELEKLDKFFNESKFGSKWGKQAQEEAARAQRGIQELTKDIRKGDKDADELVRRFVDLSNSIDKIQRKGNLAEQLDLEKASTGVRKLRDEFDRMVTRQMRAEEQVTAAIEKASREREKALQREADNAVKTAGRVERERLKAAKQGEAARTREAKQAEAQRTRDFIAAERVRTTVQRRELERALSEREARYVKSLRKIEAAFANAQNSELQRLRRDAGNISLDVALNGRSIAQAQAELKALASTTEKILLDPKVDPGSRARAIAAMKSLNVEKIKLERDVKFDVEARGVGQVRRELKRLEREQRSAILSSRDSANAFRAFNAVILTAVTLGPALVPVLAAVAGGLVAISGSAIGAAAGLGVAIAAFKGVGEAVSAMQAVEDDQAKSADDNAKALKKSYDGVADARRSLLRTQRSAAEQEADSAAAVAEAREQAQDNITRAIEAQRGAEERLTQTNRNAKQAERDLADARRQAALDRINLQNELAQGGLNKRQSRIDVFQAQVQYNAVMADGSSTNLEKEQASIELEQARLRAKQIDEANKQLAKDKKKSDREGIEGSEGVRNAQQALIDALKDQRDAQKEVGQAAKEVDEARRDGAKAVQEALEQQRRSAVASAEAIADAQRGLARAQRDYGEQVEASSKEGSAAMDNLRIAMAKLSPEQRRFAEFIFSLRGGWKEIQALSAAGFLPDLQRALESLFGTYGSGFRSFISDISTELGNLSTSMAATLEGGVMRDFFGVFADSAPVFLRLFGETSLNWMEIFSRFLTLAEPMSMAFAEALERISEQILSWSTSAKGTEKIEGFFGYVQKVGPMVKDVLFEAGRALANIGRALAPVGEAVLVALTGFFRYIGDMDPGKLRLILTTFIALVAAFQLLTGMTALVAGIAAAGQAIMYLRGAVMLLGGVLTFLGAPLALTIGAIALLVIGLVIAYKRVGWFRDFVDAAFRAVGRVVSWVWENVVKPVFAAWVSYARFMWSIIGPVLGWIGSKFSALGAWLARTWTKTIGPIFNVWWRLVQWMYGSIFKIIFGWIGDRFADLGQKFKTVWSIIRAVFVAFREWLSKDGILQSAVKGAVSVIKTIWDSLLSTFATPAKFLLDVVVNKAIIGGIRWVGDKLGMKEKELPDPIGIPKAINKYAAFASGGIPDARKLNVYPGYTPGRDTGHVIGIGGGEAIMRPEWTRAMGRDYVERMNAAARRGGVQGVQSAMYAGAFAKGGITLGGAKRVWPVPGRRTTTYPGHDGVDLNRGSGWDDYGDPIRAAAGGRVSYVGTGRGYGKATFISGPYGTLVYGHQSATMVKNGQVVGAGQLIGRVGNTGNSTAPHLHFGFPGGTTSQALAFLNGAAVMGGAMPKGGGDTSWLASVGGVVKKLGKGLWNLISDPTEFFTKRLNFDKMADFGIEKGSFFAGALRKAGSKLVDFGVKWIENKIDLFSEQEGGPKDNMGLPKALAGKNQMNNREIVKAIAAGYGWDKGSQFNALNALIMKESSYKNMAQNPSSTAFGLFQFLDSTWGGTGVKKTSDPEKQAIAGLRYIDERYGSPAAALRFHQSHGWYSEGGVVPGGEESAAGEGSGVPTMMYDNGGYLPPGITQVVNLTGKPEPVFTDGQFRDMRESRGTGGDTTVIAPVFNNHTGSASDVIDGILFAGRMLRFGGKYAGRD